MVFLVCSGFIKIQSVSYFIRTYKTIYAVTYRNNDYITEINISVWKEGEEYERNPNVMMFERMPRVGHAWKIKHIIDILQINITYHKFGINGSRIR